jgi:hypothetical protein
VEYKINTIIATFIHDVPTQLYRFLNDDERVLLMCLWQFVVIIFQEKISDENWRKRTVPGCASG